MQKRLLTIATPVVAAMLLTHGSLVYGEGAKDASRQIDSAPHAEVADGMLTGLRHDGVRVFLGIPYAAPPTGERRWRKPAPRGPWTGKRDATHAAPACPQPDIPSDLWMYAPPRESEDCLYLNVWTPGVATSRQPLPVMVWIHGGGSILGDGAAPYFNGAWLARRGVVVVTINYRLGYLGYFAAPALTRKHAPGNFALLDQIAALRWVRENIAAFGGDPDRVTVAGESAGGRSVLALMTMPAARDLFDQTIVESGGGWARPLTRKAMTGRIGKGLASVGSDIGADAGALRAIPVQQLVQANKAVKKPGFGPFLDGVTLTRKPSAAFLAGEEVPVPLLIGSNTWEGSLLSLFRLGDKWHKLVSNPMVKLLYRSESDSGMSLQQRLFADLFFAAPARWIARKHARLAPTYLYRFDYVRSARRDAWPGAPHGSEIPYVFDTLGRSDDKGSGALSKRDRAMADTVADCWAAFIKTGQPDCALGAWHRYDPKRDNMMFIDNHESHEIEHQRAAILDVIDRYLAPRASKTGRGESESSEPRTIQEQHE